MRWRAVLLCLCLAGCRKAAVPPAPDASPIAEAPVVTASSSAAPVPVASATAMATARPTPGPRPCTADEQVMPADASDLGWARRIADELRNGVDRRRLVCMFGVVDKPNGGYIELTPHSRVFSSAHAVNDLRDHPEESIEVRFPVGARPLLATVEKAIGPSKHGGRHHPETPETRIVYLDAKPDVWLRALLRIEHDDPKHVAGITLDVSDLRGWTPSPIRCEDGVTMTLWPASSGRIVPGRYSIVATGSGKTQRFSCDIGDDILVPGRCTPSAHKPPSAHVQANASGIEISVPWTQGDVTIDIERDGLKLPTTAVKLRYSSVPRQSEPGDCTTASEFVRAL